MRADPRLLSLNDWAAYCARTSCTPVGLREGQLLVRIRGPRASGTKVLYALDEKMALRMADQFINSGIGGSMPPSSARNVLRTLRTGGSRASSGSPMGPGAKHPSRLSPTQDPGVLSIDSLAKYLDEWSSFSQEMMGVLDKVLEIGEK